MYAWTDPDAGGPLAAVPVDQERWARRSLSAHEPVVVSSGADDPDRPPAPSTLPGVVFPAGGAVPLVGEGEMLGALAFGSLGDPLGVRRPGGQRAAGRGSAGERSAAPAVGGRPSRERNHEVGDPPVAHERRGGDRSARRPDAGATSSGCDLAGVFEWMDVPIGANLLDELPPGRREGRAAGRRCRRRPHVGTRRLARALHHRADETHRGYARVRSGGRSRPCRCTAPEGGAVVTCADITDLRRAEVEAQRSRQELAHVVARLDRRRDDGVAGASAQSAARGDHDQRAGWGSGSSIPRRPDLDEVRAILRDIVKDDRRASDVIQRLRALLRKGDLDMTRVESHGDHPGSGRSDQQRGDHPERHRCTLDFDAGSGVRARRSRAAAAGRAEPAAERDGGDERRAGHDAHGRRGVPAGARTARCPFVSATPGPDCGPAPRR